MRSHPHARVVLAGRSALRLCRRRYSPPDFFGPRAGGAYRLACMRDRTWSRFNVSQRRSGRAALGCHALAQQRYGLRRVSARALAAPANGLDRQLTRLLRREAEISPRRLQRFDEVEHVRRAAARNRRSRRRSAIRVRATERRRIGRRMRSACARRPRSTSGSATMPVMPGRSARACWASRARCAACRASAPGPRPGSRQRSITIRRLPTMGTAAPRTACWASAAA